MRGVILLLIILLSITAASGELKPADFIQSEYQGSSVEHEDGTPGVKLQNPGGIQIVGDYAFITATGLDAFQVINISDLYNLKPAGFIQSEFGEFGQKYEDGTPGL